MTCPLRVVRWEEECPGWRKKPFSRHRIPLYAGEQDTKKKPVRHC
ncbi:hypothetical protein DESPIG_02116 [Desulfovibrio piger ATCC 29098]|uniref:Uncharacterized protein n=1 Tax=Desulfovibrio piger ATCC 29098 TaxID=411464 RepID=B6WVK1_9BACT|nr:hypothetical protein DESPIG_02116 [Desulfovibrio piger ATCC 29098]